MCLMKSHPSPDLIIGYTTRRHLLLDLDKTSLTKTAALARLIMREYPEVGDCLILRSSEGDGAISLKYDNYQRPYHRVNGDSFHLVFDGLIGYNKACRIIEALAGVHVLNRDYVKIREFRGDMTLRISSTSLYSGLKPAPVCVTGIKNKAFKGVGEGIEAYLRVSGRRSLSQPTRQGSEPRAL